MPLPTALDQLLIKPIAQDGTPLPSRRYFNLLGSVSCADNPGFVDPNTGEIVGSTDITITGGSGGGQFTTTVANGLNSNVPTNGLTSLRVGGPTAAFSIGGLAIPGGSTPGAGQTLVVINTTSQPMTVVHEDAGTTAKYRIAVGAGVPSTIPTGGRVTLNYDGTISRWLLQDNGELYRRVYDVRDYGAKCDGTTDDATAIQAAINAALDNSGGTVHVPDLCAIGTTLTVGGVSNPVFGLVLRGPKRPMPTTGGATAGLKWIGASSGTMLIVRNAYGGVIENLCFDANNLAAYGVQFNAVIGDGNTIDGWHVNHCGFANATTYNVLIGVPDGSASTGNTSTLQFNSCVFQMTYAGTTTAHVRHRSANSLGNSFHNCEFWGTQGTVAPVGGHYQPLYGLDISGGTVNMYSCISGGFDTVDILLATPTFGDVPGGVCLFGHQSQSANFLRVDPRDTAAPFYPVVVSGCQHSDIFNTGTYSILWNRGGYATLVVEGGYFDRGITVSDASSDVTLLGPWWTAARGGATVGGHPEAVFGHWRADANWYAGVQATDRLAVNAPALKFNAAQATPVITIDAPTSDVAPTDLHIKGQAPYASASTHKTPGDVYIGPEEPVAGGGLGALHLTNGTVDALDVIMNSVRSVTSLSLPSGVNQLLLSAQGSGQTIALTAATTITYTAGTFMEFVANSVAAMSVQSTEVAVGVPLVLTGQNQATSATAGTHGAVPAQVAGYFSLSFNGTTVQIPYFNS